MNTAQYRLRGKRHSGLTDQFTVQQETAPDVWAPVNLTGYTPRLQVRDEPHEEATLILTLTEGDGLLLDGAAGRVTIHIDEARSVDIPPGSWWFDLRLDPPAGDAVYLIAGPFLFETVVTLP